MRHRKIVDFLLHISTAILPRNFRKVVQNWPWVILFRNSSPMNRFRKNGCEREARRLLSTYENHYYDRPLCLTMYNVHNGRCPSYLSDMFQPADAPSRPLRLRSADSSSYVKPRLRTKFGERAFSNSGPAAWNQLRPLLGTYRRTRQLSSLCF